MPVDREKIVSSAQKYAEKKRFDKAIEEYGKLIAEDANDVRALLKIGDLQLKMQAYAQAVETYDRVGKNYASAGSSIKAVAVYKQIREIIAKHVPELEQRYGHVLPRLADLYQALGLTSDALAAYDEIATTELRRGRDKEAIAAFRKIVELDTQNPLPHLRLAEALARVKDMDGALAQFGSAADLLVRLGRTDDALKVMDRVLQIRPDPVYAKRAARMFLERNHANDGMLALAKLQIAFQANQKDLETLSLLAKAFEKIGQRPKAIEVEKEMARLAREQGDIAVFQEVIQHLVQVAPNDEVVKALARQSMPSVQEIDADSVSVSEDELSEDEAEALESVDFIHSQAAPHLARGAVSVRDPIIAEGSEDDAEAEAQAYAQQAIAEASHFRRQNRHNKAIDTLRVALEVIPSSTELHEALRDVLLEVGDRNGAANEMIALAEHHIDRADGPRALAALNECLLLFPTHPRARELLADLGYEEDEQDIENTHIGVAPPGIGNHRPEGPRQSFATAEALAGYDTVIAETQSDVAMAAYDPSRPLPSYDLEDIGHGDIMSTGRPQLTEVDDPFGLPPEAELVPEQPSVEEIEEVEEAPLPSFALEEDHEPDPQAPLDAATDVAEAPKSLTSTRGFTGGDSIEEALEEVDFFAGRGLFDDARAILDEQLARFPRHPLILERIRELADLEAQASPPPVDQDEVTQAMVGREDQTAETAPISNLRGDLDIDSSLDALDSFEPEPEARAHMQDSEQVDVEAVFAKFQEGVKAQVDDSDSATHYDLGLAYRDMGLLPAAIDEFNLAAKDPRRACVCLSMVAIIEQERGNEAAAIAAYERALASPMRTTEQEVAIHYDLGVIYETRKDKERALHHYGKVSRRDPTFRDVQERLKKLTPAPARRAGAQKPEEDFDSVFDDIVGGSKLPLPGRRARTRRPSAGAGALP